MSDLASIRKGLAKNIATIRGLRVKDYQSDNPSPPFAEVSFPTVQYDGAFHKGLEEWQFTIQVIVGRASEREAQRRLDAFVSGSFKDAVESDRTLSGSAYDVRVTEMSGVSAVSLSDQTYLAADFQITVYA
jgi:hypothetical protein